jgi:predicted nucleic acid-binding protein
MSDQWAKVRYLDASAMVKLVVDEDDCRFVREFFQNNTSFCATSLCLAEALGVIKGKWNYKRLTKEQYFEATKTLIIHAWGKKIEVDNVDLFTPHGHANVEKIAKKYSLDLSDALQLETIRHGRYSVLGPQSASVLITADGPLARAADSEGIRVWNCSKGPAPFGT